jgi:hypothetical protein
MGNFRKRDLNQLEGMDKILVAVEHQTNYHVV